MIPTVALQKAVYQELSKGSYQVFEVVPSDIGKMPFITIGDINKETNFTKGNEDRFNISITLHSWSNANSSVESKEMEEFIYQTLMNLELTLFGYDVEFISLDLNTNYKEADSKDKSIFHSVQGFGLTISKQKG